MKEKLFDPLISVCLNPELSTPDKPVFEDDTRMYLPDPPNPENLTICMDFFNPLTDKHFDYVQERRKKLGLSVITNDSCLPSTQNDHTESLISSIDPVYPKIVPKIENKNIIDNISGKKKTAYRPIDIAERLLQNFEFRVLEKSLYFYNRFCYEFISKDDFKILFMTIAMNDLRQIGHINVADDVFDILIHFPSIQIGPENIVENLIAFNNAVFDTKSFSLIAPNPNNFFTFQLNCNFVTQYQPCYVFESFLDDITGGDEALRTRIWEFLGYCLSPDIKAKKIFVLQGFGDSGKSVLSNLLKSFYPAKTFTSLSVAELENNFAASHLFGKHLCLSGDLPSYPFRSNTVSILKKISGNDPINCDRKFQSRAEMECKARFVLASNHFISLTHKDEPFIKRLIAIPFSHPIPSEKIDTGLLNRLTEEKEAIAIKALGYYQRLVNNNYVFTGDFPINSRGCFQYTDDEVDQFPTDIPSEVHLYLITNVEACDNSYITIEELHKNFVDKFHAISVNQFSTICREISEKVFLAEKKKARVQGYANPVHVIMGIRWIRKD